MQRPQEDLPKRAAVNSAGDEGFRDARLKVIIASTPKTGNTWVKHILAKLYALPIVPLPTDSRAIDWDALGDRWIGHQHYLPTPELLTAAAERNVQFVTTVRHPGDTFVSLVHHVRRESETAATPRESGFMVQDAEPFGSHAEQFLKHGFLEHLHLSIVWMQSGCSRIVRYEDLCAHPLPTLLTLAESLAPVPRSSIRRALVTCEIDQMRQENPERRAFFRKGISGSWIQELPPDFQHILASRAPYPEQVQRLGYSMKPEVDQATANGMQPQRLTYPLRNRATFDDGTPVVDVMKNIFFEVPEPMAESWGDTLTTAPDSFYSWLNQPVAIENVEATPAPFITELAHFIYKTRPDLQQAFPSPFGQDHRAFTEWFISRAPIEYGLAPVFTDAMSASLRPACVTAGVE